MNNGDDTRVAWRARTEENRMKGRAYDAVRYAVKTGKLVRQPCYVCGRDKAQAHHQDYSKPLQVQWLCSCCHYAEHVIMRREDRLPIDPHGNQPRIPVLVDGILEKSPDVIRYVPSPEGWKTLVRREPIQKPFEPVKTGWKTLVKRRKRTL